MTMITMTKMMTRNSQVYVWMAAIFSLSLMAGCSSPSNNTGSQAARSEQKPTSTPQLTLQEVAQEVVELAATREAYKLTPDTARQKLEKFAKLEDGMSPEEKQTSPDQQRLIGANPAAGIQWIKVEFRQNVSENGK